MSSTPTLIINLSNLVSSAALYHGYEPKRSAYLFHARDHELHSTLGDLHVKPRPQFQSLTQPHIQWQFTLGSRCMGFGMMYYRASTISTSTHEATDKYLELKPTNPANYSTLQYWLDTHDKSIILSADTFDQPQDNYANTRVYPDARLTLPTDPS